LVLSIQTVDTPALNDPSYYIIISIPVYIEKHVWKFLTSQRKYWRENKHSSVQTCVDDAQNKHVHTCTHKQRVSPYNEHRNEWCQSLFHPYSKQLVVTQHDHTTVEHVTVCLWHRLQLSTR
jgi:hypothetical protein